MRCVREVRISCCCDFFFSLWHTEPPLFDAHRIKPLVPPLISPTCSIIYLLSVKLLVLTFSLLRSFSHSPVPPCPPPHSPTPPPLSGPIPTYPQARGSGEWVGWVRGKRKPRLEEEERGGGVFVTRRRGRGRGRRRVVWAALLRSCPGRVNNFYSHNNKKSRRKSPKKRTNKKKNRLGV